MDTADWGSPNRQTSPATIRQRRSHSRGSEQSDSRGWTEIASIVVSGLGTVAVLIALVFTIKQAKILSEKLDLDHKQAQRSAVVQRAANDLKLMGYTMALDRLFIRQPALRPYFYGGRDVPDSELGRSRVLATAELIVDLADTVSSMMRHKQLDGGDRRAWEKALETYGDNAAVRQIIAEDDSQGAWRDSTLALLQGRTNRPTEVR